MAGMSMSLRVVVPPHPLIEHWLTLLRDRQTPSPLFATAMGELGRWLTYEALRDWLPQRSVEVETPLERSEGRVIDPEVPLLAVPVLRGGLGLWDGARTVLPAARVAHVGLQAEGPGEPAHWYLDDLPEAIGERVGLLVFLPVLASGATAIAVLERLKALGVEGPRRCRPPLWNRRGGPLRLNAPGPPRPTPAPRSMAHSPDRSSAGGTAIVASALAGAMVGAAGIAWWLLSEADRRRRLQRQQRLLSLSRDQAIDPEPLAEKSRSPLRAAPQEAQLHDRVKQLNQAIDDVRRQLERLQPQG